MTHSERIDLDNGQRSRRLPPLEAWKRPDKWLNLSTGLVKPDAPKLHLNTDDRGLLRPDEAIEAINEMYFWRDYDWPYMVGDVQTQPDMHHFYHYRSWYSLSENDGSPLPSTFRELPTTLGMMPRQFHNALHDLTIPPEKPELEVMSDYIDAYQLAQQAFMRLFKAAKSLAIVDKMPALSVVKLLNNYQPTKRINEVEAAFMQSFFETHFKQYSLAIELFHTAEKSSEVYDSIRRAEANRLDNFIKSLGELSTRKYFNFTPLLQAS